VDGLDEVLLRLGKIDVRSVSTPKAVYHDIHLFAFHTRGEPHAHYDHIRLTGRFDGIAQEVGFWRRPDQLHLGVGKCFDGFHHHFILPARFQFHRGSFSQARIAVFIAKVIDRLCYEAIIYV
jgi:hypothetical protein